MLTLTSERATTTRTLSRPAASPANRDLRAIADLLKEVESRIDDWLEEHGEDCSCAYCAHQHLGKDDPTTKGELAEAELRGLKFLLSRSLGSTDLVSETPDELLRMLM